MAQEEQTINCITYIVSVYLGYVNIVTGLIGNSINIFVFTQLKLFRNNPSAFYLIIAAMVESLQLIFVVSSRVLTASNGYDPTVTSIVWCKLRAYFSQVGATLLPMIICSSAIDQYLSTSYHLQLRQMSTFKLAQRLVAILFTVTIVYSIPTAIFQDIHVRVGCGTYNSSYNYYYSFVHLCILTGLLPITISTLFSLLSFRNVRRIIRRQMPIHRRRLDRQLTAMILVRVALFVIVTLPLVSVRTYQINRFVDSNDDYAVAVDQLIRISVVTFYNINYSGSFYVFLATSSRYRRQVKYLVCKKLWQKLKMIKGNKNDVAPANQQQTVEAHVSAIEVD